MQDFLKKEFHLWLSVREHVNTSLPEMGHLWFKRIYLLDVIVKTPRGKVRNVIILADALGVLSSRRTKWMNEFIWIYKKRSCDANILLHNCTTHLEVLNEEASCCIVDHCVERVWVQRQRVVIVKAVDVHFSQADLVVSVDGGGVEEVTRARWDQVWSRENRWETLIQMPRLKVKYRWNQRGTND